MENLYVSKTFLKMVGRRMHTPRPSPPGSAPGHNLQTPSKESGIFQPLGSINFVLATRAELKGRAWHNALPKCAPDRKH